MGNVAENGKVFQYGCERFHHEKCSETNIVLRKWELDDAPHLHKLASDPLLTVGWVKHSSVQYSADVIENIFSISDSYAITVRKGKTTSPPVGCISVKTSGSRFLSLNQGEGEIGFWVGRKFQNQGLGLASLCTLTRHCFSAKNLHTLWCSSYETNVVSRRIQEKCGFVLHHFQDEKNHTITEPFDPLSVFVRGGVVFCYSCHVSS